MTPKAAVLPAGTPSLERGDPLAHIRQPTGHFDEATFVLLRDQFTTRVGIDGPDGPRRWYRSAPILWFRCVQRSVKRSSINRLTSAVCLAAVRGDVPNS